MCPMQVFVEPSDKSISFCLDMTVTPEQLS